MPSSRLKPFWPPKPAVHQERIVSTRVVQINSDPSMPVFGVVARGDQGGRRYSECRFDHATATRHAGAIVGLQVPVRSEGKNSA